MEKWGNMLMMVYQYCTAGELYTALRVSRHWHQLARSDSAWRATVIECIEVDIALTRDRYEQQILDRINLWWRHKKGAPLPLTLLQEYDENGLHQSHQQPINNTPLSTEEYYAGRHLDHFCLYRKLSSFVWLQTLSITIDTQQFDWGFDWSRIWECSPNLRRLGVRRRPRYEDGLDDWNIYTDMAVYMPHLTELTVYNGLFDRDAMMEISRIPQLTILQLQDSRCAATIDEYNDTCDDEEDDMGNDADDANDVDGANDVDDDDNDNDDTANRMDDDEQEFDPTKYLWMCSEIPLTRRHQPKAAEEKMEDMTSVFAHMKNLQTLNLNWWATDGVNGISRGLLLALSSSTSLTHIDLDTNLNFRACHSLATKLRSTLTYFKVAETSIVATDDFSDESVDVKKRKRSEERRRQ